MAASNQSNDPLEFVKGMWSSMGINLPGMVTPTLDTDELDKRISDLKTVEGWLKMNLNMLTMSIQGLEMQRAALAAMKAMGQTATSPDAQAANPFTNPALWPWNFMQQPAQEDQAAPPAASNPTEAPKPANTPPAKQEAKK